MSSQIGKTRYYYDFHSLIQKLLKDEECFICGSKKELEAHHIRSVKSNSEQYSNPNNIIILCRYHHHLYHQLYDKTNQKTFAEFCKFEFNKGTVIKNKENTINQLKNELKNVKKENKKLKNKIVEGII